MSGMHTIGMIVNLPRVPPELKLVAAIIADAFDLAKGGDTNAATWLRRCAPAWLAFIVPDGIDWEVIHHLLLEQIPTTDGDAAMQMELELEAA